jgi:SnoaL-like protein
VSGHVTGGRSADDPAGADAARDVVAIESLLKRYCALVDEQDGDAIVRDIFAEDGSDDHGEGPRRGAEAIRSWFRDNLANIATSAHLLTNVEIEIDEDSARAKSYVMAWVWTVAAENGDPGRPATYVVVASYDDRLTRTAKGWRIAERVVRPAGAGRHLIALGAVPVTQTGLTALVARSQAPATAT